MNLQEPMLLVTIPDTQKHVPSLVCIMINGAPFGACSEGCGVSSLTT